MSETPHQPRSITLSLPPAEHWTLHHVLLDRIERATTATEPSDVEPPPVEVVRAFETLDAGEISFTPAQLDAMQAVLGEYHHAPSWERDRSRIEHLLHRITDAIKRNRPVGSL